ncbi:MAG: glycerol-3-phosphate dehydrogenase [Moraxellaceae bacterium]|nr:MAG: glycerol-3-phosphate dehydrogenase [Moraxellaceae bacterium]
MHYGKLIYDAFVIGGGINGAAIAKHLACKGFSTALCDESDLSGDTSSHSDKLFQCGLDHLENLDLGHVSSALKERDILEAEVPHLMHPLDIVIPNAPEIRSSLKMKAGTLLYGWLRHSEATPRPHTEDIKNTLYGAPLRNHTEFATLSQEHLINDSRLVIENLLSAQLNNCQLLPQTKVIKGSRSDGMWTLTLKDSHSGDTVTVSARCLINAAGAWAQSVLEQTLSCATRCEQAIEKHNFIAIPKFYKGNHGYTLQLPKQQFLSILPYAESYCLVGPITSPSSRAAHNSSVDSEIKDVLIQQINTHFRTQFSTTDISWSFSTIKPEHHDAHQPIHMLDIQCSDGLSPVISVFSGHLTTHRILAEQVYECMQPYLPANNNSVTYNRLPGGDFNNESYSEFVCRLTKQYSWLPESLVIRYCATYGARTESLLEGISDRSSLGNEILPTLFEFELRWLIEQEWVTCAEDILWRRTRLGTTASTIHTSRLTRWFNNHYRHRPAVSKLTTSLHINRKAC